MGSYRKRWRILKEIERARERVKFESLAINIYGESKIGQYMVMKEICMIIMEKVTIPRKGENGRKYGRVGD